MLFSQNGVSGELRTTTAGNTQYGVQLTQLGKGRFIVGSQTRCLCRIAPVGIQCTTTTLVAGYLHLITRMQQQRYCPFKGFTIKQTARASRKQPHPSRWFIFWRKTDNSRFRGIRSRLSHHAAQRGRFGENGFSDPG